jgi:hypothetical protein
MSIYTCFPYVALASSYVLATSVSVNFSLRLDSIADALSLSSVVGIACLAGALQHRWNQARSRKERAMVATFTAILAFLLRMGRKDAEGGCQMLSLTDPFLFVFPAKNPLRFLHMLNVPDALLPPFSCGGQRSLSARIVRMRTPAIQSVWKFALPGQHKSRQCGSRSSANIDCNGGAEKTLGSV